MKAKHCLDCAFHSIHGEANEKLRCGKGHKPRFYKGDYPYYSTDYGWKRDCADFKYENKYAAKQAANAKRFRNEILGVRP